MEKLFKNKYALGVYGKDDELIIMAYSVNELAESMGSKLNVVRKIVSTIYTNRKLEDTIVVNHKKYTLYLIDITDSI